jgi:RNA polymerase sigma factor (TIGR02999 family)
MSHDLTRLLRAAEAGEARAAEDLLPAVYDQLRNLAAAKMAGQPAGHTLQATALVHEAWLRVADENHLWENRRHFFAAAAEAMRRILVDRARAKGRAKRGGGRERVPLETIDLATETPPEDVLRVHEALDRLAAADPLKAELIKLRFFVGLRIPEAAQVLAISASTAKRHWRFARAWLYDELRTDS